MSFHILKAFKLCLNKYTKNKIQKFMITHCKNQNVRSTKKKCQLIKPKSLSNFFVDFLKLIQLFCIFLQWNIIPISTEILKKKKKKMHEANSSWILLHFGFSHFMANESHPSTERAYNLCGKTLYRC